MASIVRLLDRVLFTAIGVLLAAMVADVTIQVLFRYVIQDPPVWTEEAARFIFTWQIFLATALAFGRGSHIVVDAVHMAVPLPVKRYLALLTNILILGFMLVVTWEGIIMTQMTADTKSVGLQLNMGVVYAALPVGAAISLPYIVINLLGLLRGAPAVTGPAPTNMVD